VRLPCFGRCIHCPGPHLADRTRPGDEPDGSYHSVDGKGTVCSTDGFCHNLRLTAPSL
jgi:hypothetical protein